MQAKPRTIDEYLDRLDEVKRAALQKLRAAIQAAAPEAEECISYSMPAFRLHGRILAYFHAAAHHCSFFPGAYPIETLADQLTAYSTSKGTVRFPPDKPLSAALVRKLVKAAIAGRGRRAARPSSHGRRRSRELS
jgi:uncharacterized protein YdhG (YjbR/CyaY superfamily)